MLRTIFTIGIFAVLGLIALKLAFGIVFPLMGLFLDLVWLAIRIAILGLVVYLVVRVVSPERARRLRERLGR